MLMSVRLFLGSNVVLNKSQAINEVDTLKLRHSHNKNALNTAVFILSSYLPQSYLDFEKRPCSPVIEVSLLSGLTRLYPLVRSSCLTRLKVSGIP